MNCNFKLNSLLAALFATLPLTVLAAPPDAGSIIQQIKPAMPPAPSSTDTGLTIGHENGASQPFTVPFLVKSVQITGNTLIDTATLHALIADAEGKELTLAQLHELAKRITDYYHAHNYPLARAIVPAQTVHDGIVNIEIIEARYGRVSVNNKSQVNDGLIQDTLSPLHNGQVITQDGLDHSLLLLSDMQGVAVNATLLPGAAVGTSDLQINIAPGKTVSGNVALDNYGNRYTGRTRAGGTVNLIDPLHYGDVLSLSGLTSGSGMNYGRIAYDTLINGRGTHLGGSVSALHYILGDVFSNLNGHGTAQIESLWAKHPFMRTRDINLYGQVQYDHKQLRDHIDASAPPTRNDRHLDNGTVSVAGDARTGRGISTWNLAVTSGHVGFDDGAAQLNDAASAKTQGSFSKWNLNLSRLQGVFLKSALYLSLSAQGSNHNLDSAEKMVAGGPYTVRAYDMGSVSGDSGYLGSIELRQNLTPQWQALVFVDSEHVTVNHTPWIAGTNSATLNGAGVGINWAGQSQWGGKAYIAKRLGSAPVLVANASSVRAWVEIDKGF
jgi:hemolysin activation/secretion protein